MKDVPFPGFLQTKFFSIIDICKEKAPESLPKRYPSTKSKQTQKKEINQKPSMKNWYRCLRLPNHPAANIARQRIYPDRPPFWRRSKLRRWFQCCKFPTVSPVSICIYLLSPWQRQQLFSRCWVLWPIFVGHCGKKRHLGQQTEPSATPVFSDKRTNRRFPQREFHAFVKAWTAIATKKMEKYSSKQTILNSGHIMPMDHCAIYK